LAEREDGADDDADAFAALRDEVGEEGLGRAAGTEVDAEEDIVVDEVVAGAGCDRDVLMDSVGMGRRNWKMSVQ